MSNSGDLLRMLEPAVRPVATPGNGATPRPTAFESQSFEQLLDTAQQTQEPVNPATEPNEPPASDPLASLSRIDAVNNASLRRILHPQA